MRKYFLLDNVDIAAKFDAVVTSIDVPIPEPKRYTIDVPYGNGCIDLSLVNGHAVYNNRDIELEIVGAQYEHSWVEVESWLSQNVNGRIVKLKISDDMDWTYSGFATVSKIDWAATNAWRATIKIDADPYKTMPNARLRVDAIGGTTIGIWGYSKPTQPVFTFKTETAVSNGSETWIMQRGSYRITDLWLERGANQLYFNVNVGDGDVAISSFGEETIAEHAKQRIAELTWVSIPTEYMTIADLSGFTEKELENERIYDLRKEMTIDPDDYYITIEYERGEL